MKKLFFGVCTATMLVGTVMVGTHAQPRQLAQRETTPLPSDHWAYAEMERMQSSGCVKINYGHEPQVFLTVPQFADKFCTVWQAMRRDLQAGLPLDSRRAEATVRLARFLSPELPQRGGDVYQVQALVARALLSKPFLDIPPRHWAGTAIERSRVGAVLIGYPGGTFMAPHQAASGKATIGDKPYLGWSSWSLEATKYPGYGGQDWLTAQHVKEQSDAMAAKLQKHGYMYINIDAGWRGGWDENGLPTPNPTKFPGGIEDVADYVHAKGQKLGIYYVPGIDDDLLGRNPLIKGTNRRIRDIVFTPRRLANGWGGGNAIDFSKPGAQEYIQSIADQFASWGVDFLKFDGVTPGSDQSNSAIDARPDVAAWGKALKNVAHPIWLTISWHVDMRHNDYWRQHANAIRTGSDVESYDDKLTHWGQISLRFASARDFASLAGTGKGWNDLDALLVGNGQMSDLTPDERRTAVTLWAISCSPMYSGDDLTKLDDLGLELLTNDEIIAVQQSGNVAKPLGDGFGEQKKQVWVTSTPNGGRIVALFNLDDKPQTVSVRWKEAGIQGPVALHDLWSHQRLGIKETGFEAVVPPHGCRLVRALPTRIAD